MHRIEIVERVLEQVYYLLRKPESWLPYGAARAADADGNEVNPRHDTAVQFSVHGAVLAALGDRDGDGQIMRHIRTHTPDLSSHGDRLYADHSESVHCVLAAWRAASFYASEYDLRERRP